LRTHRPVAGQQFACLAKNERRIERELVTFLAKANELKSVADYGMNSAAKITTQEAMGAIETAARFVECIEQLVLSQDELST
jgi:uncharacterized protein (UPF0332 family)